MGHAFFRGWQLRAAVICVIACVFAALAGTVRAASTTSSSGSTTCGASGCSYQTSGSSTATFAGQFDTPAVVIDQSLCPAQAADPTDTICGHFAIDTGAATGTITMTINFAEENDLDLCIVQGVPPLATIVGCSTGSGPSETVTITLNQCVDPHFEAQILPISYPFPGPTPAAPVTYTGTITSNLTVCGAGSSNGGSPDPPIVATPTAPDFGYHRMTGGGRIASGNVSNKVIQRRDGTYDGKVRFSGLGCDLRSTQITSVVWDDLNNRATIAGKASLNRGMIVDFVLTLDDNGDPGTADFYDMKSVCGGTGNLLKGKLDYRVRT